MDTDAIRMLETSDEDVAEGSAKHVIRLLTDLADRPDQAKQLRGKIVLAFSTYDSDPRPNYLIPEIRRFIRSADEGLPHLPYFLLGDPAAGHLEFYLLCLIEPRTPEGGLLAIDLMEVIERKIAEVTRFCHRIGDDAERATEPLLLNVPATLAAGVPELAKKILRIMRPTLEALLRMLRERPSGVSSSDTAQQEAEVVDQLGAKAAVLVGLDRNQYHSPEKLIEAVLEITDRVTNEQLESFQQRLDACMIRVGRGKLSASSDAVRKLVREEPDSARRYIELQCFLATGQPGYLQPALIIAAAYAVEFDDKSLIEMVTRRARELDAEDQLHSMSYAPTQEAVRAEPPERAKARDWWRAQLRDKLARCAACNEPIRRGHGYLVNRRADHSAPGSMASRKELICQRCFDRTSAELVVASPVESPTGTATSPPLTGSPDRAPSPHLADSKADEVDCLIEDVVLGRRPLEHIRAWATRDRSRYARPSMSGILQRPPEERARALDEYSDWETRVHLLLRTLNRWMEKAKELTEADGAVTILEAVVAATEVLGSSRSAANPSFQLGHLLWKRKSYPDAVPYLEAAISGFNQDASDSGAELWVLGLLEDSLHRAGDNDRALEVVDALIARARELVRRGHVASALRDKGTILGALGRDGVLECLREALTIRRHLTPEELVGTPMVPLGGYLDALGAAARSRGVYDEAIEAFTECAELERQEGNQGSYARAVSEIGYTYLFAGEPTRAGEFLDQAAKIADAAGDAFNAGRWRMQSRSLAGDDAVIGEIPNRQAAGTQVFDERTAYEQASWAELLAQRKLYDRAASLAVPVLDWAQVQGDVDIEINMRNVLGVCTSNLGDQRGGIQLLQRAIYLADGHRKYALAITLRQNLAHVYLAQQRNKDAAEVLLAGIAFGQSLVARADSSEFRQEIAAAILPLYETYANIASQLGNPEAFVSITETARARNFFGWINAAHKLEWLAGSEAAAARVTLEKLRAVEVETEVRHFTRQIDARVIRELRESRERLRSELQEYLRHAGVENTDDLWEHDTRAKTGRELLDGVLSTNLAVVYLFSVSEGICAAVAPASTDSMDFVGGFISWDRKERVDLLSRWADWVGPNRAMMALRGSVPQRVGTVKDPTPLDDVAAIFGTRLFDALLPLLSQVPGRDVLVIPQGELALVPFWGLLDRYAPNRSLCVAPSLGVYALCAARHPATKGQAILVGDVTNTLTHVATELDCVRAVRDNAIRADTIDDLLDAADRTTLLHVAAHGIFNKENPYYSGILMGRKSDAEGVLVRYVSRHGFSPRPEAESVRVMTVGECMSALSLNSCRLAVLSACESGLSRLHGAGEMTGLPSAMLIAGAKAVIASLWRVSDAAATVLMHQFYEVWEGGGGQEANVGRSLALARQALASASRQDVQAIVGKQTTLPDQDPPFAHPIFTDAFQCYGAID
jgi:tetratricopeptide (TPR) repeat protein